MKKCAYCGRENEDGAVHCQECGTTEFKNSPIATSPDPTIAKCDRCGATTDIVGGFFKERKCFSHSMRTLCPTCWQKHNISVQTRLLIFQLVPGPLGLLYLFLLPNDGMGWFLLNFFVFEIALILSILPHEFGHAFMAKRIGWRVFKIFIGFGKTVFNPNSEVADGGGLAETKPECARPRAQPLASCLRWNISQPPPIPRCCARGRAHSVHPNFKIAADGTAEPPRCEYLSA
jgi:hypothetical protein